MKIFNTLLATAAVVLLPAVTFASTLPSPGSAPIDGGATILGAACAGYGIKKLYDAKKKKNDN